MIVIAALALIGLGVEIAFALGLGKAIHAGNPSTESSQPLTKSEVVQIRQYRGRIFTTFGLWV